MNKNQHIEDDSIHELEIEYFKESLNKDIKRWNITKSELNKIIRGLK